MSRALLLLLCLLGGRLAAAEQPVTLLELYDASLTNEAVYQAAGHAYRASQYEEDIGRGPLLPQLSLGSQVGQGGLIDGGSREDYVQSDEYSGNSVTLALQQQLFDKARWAGYQQAKVRGRVGELEFRIAGQSLFQRVAEAYFEVARINNELRLAQQQKAAIEALARQAERLFEAGEGTLTDRDEAQARLDLVLAEEIDLKARRVAALRTLSGRAGLPVARIEEMQENLPPATLLADDQNLEHWLTLAGQSSPLLEVSRAAVSLAAAEARARRAAHYPTLALVGQLSHSDEEDVNADRYRQSTYYIGLKLDLPLYRGGAVSAASSQALASLRQSQADYDAQLQALAEEIEDDYLAVLGGLQKSRALQTAVRSNQRALESAEKGYQAGLRTTVDILDAQQRLFEARRDLLNTKLQVLGGYIGLHTRTGRMDRALLQQVQALL